MINGFNILIAVGVFAATMLTDLIWVFYIRRVTQGKAFAAATFGTMIVLLGAFVVISYVENVWYIIPMTLGAFVGTYLAVKIDSKIDRKKKRNHPPKI